jgi:hypothetical protein
MPIGPPGLWNTPCWGDALKAVGMVVDGDELLALVGWLIPWHGLRWVWGAHA